MDSKAAKTFIDRFWDDEIIPQLVDYIRIPNKSPAFDPEWRAHAEEDVQRRVAAEVEARAH